MTLKKKARFETFNDGLLSVYSVDADGTKRVLRPKISGLRYAERTVGFRRFYDAMQTNVKLDFAVRIARLDNISTQDVAILRDGHQYSIVQVQFPPNTSPPCCDLSLERLVNNYDIEPIR